jgi:hypothetical protein
MLLNPKLIAITSIASVAFGVACGWSVRDAFCDSDALAATSALIKAKDDGQAKVDAGAARFETFRASLPPQREIDRTTIKEAYRNVPVPADCAIRPDALGVLDAARIRANAAATGQSGKPVPDDRGTDSADRS